MKVYGYVIKWWTCNGQGEYKPRDASDYYIFATKEERDREADHKPTYFPCEIELFEREIKTKDNG